MSKKKSIIREITQSGIIPLLCGSFILLTDPGIFWGLIGFSSVCIGIVFGYQYTSKPAQDTSDSRIKEVPE